MQKRVSIMVLLHERQRYATSAEYLLWLICDAWRAQGHRVSVQFGVSRPLSGDLVIPHLDLTRTPEEYVRALSAHPCVVNRRINDISKRRISRYTVEEDDAWDGPVIVKTNLNYGGVPERRVRRATVEGRLRDYLERARGPARRSWMDPLHYPVYPSRRDVPKEFFHNQAVLVERFLPERDGDLYCVRTYIFCGDRYTSDLLKAPHPMVKGENAVQRYPVPLHADIAKARAALGCDYGKLDYVVHDGEAVLLDISRTPGVVGTPVQRRAKGEHYAAGLLALLESACAGAP